MKERVRGTGACVVMLKCMGMIQYSMNVFADVSYFSIYCTMLSLMKWAIFSVLKKRSSGVETSPE